MDTALIAETVTITGHGGFALEAYAARPVADTTRGGVVVIHHLPGYDRETKEFVRRFADAGYDAICPNLYARVGPDVSYDDAAAAVRAGGGVPDEQVMGDVRGGIGMTDRGDDPDRNREPDNPASYVPEEVAQEFHTGLRRLSSDPWPRTPRS